MRRNMREWARRQTAAGPKRAIPILSFPSVQLLGVTVRELISDSGVQARGMKAVADRTPQAGASVSLMDLSVEAECFGAEIHVSEDEVPTVVRAVIPAGAEEEERMERAQSLAVPAVGSGRTGIYLEAVRQAAAIITDRPVFAGAIGPFSLAGRLLDVSEAMVYCYEEPEMVHAVLEKCTAFLTAYLRAYRETGANGVMIAEPLAGLLSPALAREFSGGYCRRIVEAVQTDDFIVLYHNCGNTAFQTLDSILSCGAAGYHFGNAVSMAEVLERMPPDVLAMGNLDPAGIFRNGTPESTRRAARALLEACGGFSNFVPSSGCDIPPMSRWENLDAFFETVQEYYAGRA